MHHPLDVAGGVLIGLGALLVLLFACRAAGVAHEARSPQRAPVAMRHPHTHKEKLQMAQNVSAPDAPIRRAQGKGSDFARSRQFEWLARAGIATRGVIYAIIGVLAIKLAFGSGGKTTNQQGALAEIAKQPFGKALLILTAIGLAGYAIWRLVRAAIGHGPEASDDTKERIDGVASGIGVRRALHHRRDRS